jgi:xanthine dehydrogenase small subunit
MRARRRADVRQTIRFLFGDEVREIARPPATQTVLEWLRDGSAHQAAARHCGTKEGCAEGGCGACTVVLGEPDGAGMRYRAVNACILFLPALDGKQLITVEHLRGPDGLLHAVQQAMVDHHASQCGFCTPGFVMSLFALYHAGHAAARAEVVEALSGNLCRCTGYRPIIDAGLAACAGRPADRFAASAAETAARLRALDDRTMLDTGRDGDRFIAPRSADALASVLQEHPDAILLGGATDVGLWVTKQHRHLPILVATEHVRELQEVAERDGKLLVGGAVTYADAGEALARHWPSLHPLLARLGGLQIRNAGTIGGNIGNASPIGDMPPALIALDATLVLGSAAGERRLAVEEFFVGYRRTTLAPGEFIARIEIPLPAPGLSFATYKVSKRMEDDISAVCAGCRLELAEGRVREIRIAYGGMAATPLRCSRAEAALRGRAWDRAAVAAGMEALDAEMTPLSDMRASAAYRSLVARNLLLRFYLETAEPGTRVRLEDAA